LRRLDEAARPVGEFLDIHMIFPQPAASPRRHESSIFIGSPRPFWRSPDRPWPSPTFSAGLRRMWELGI
jgi:hypothetical protein